MLPRSLEEFYQQAGRAGRDRNLARCILQFCDEQAADADHVLDPSVPPEQLKAIVNRLDNGRSDVLRNAFFIWNNFPGKRDDKAKLFEVVMAIESLEQRTGAPRTRVALAFGKGNADNERELTEKALHRLYVIGWIKDYTVDHNNKRFEVQLGLAEGRSGSSLMDNLRTYVRRYLPSDRQAAPYLHVAVSADIYKAATVVAGSLVDFIYDRVERQRREAMRQMLAVAREAAAAPSAEAGDRVVRTRLQGYLQPQKFTEEVRRLLEEDLPMQALALWDRVADRADCHWLMGACRRFRESYPEHIGLIALEALCLMESKQADAAAREAAICVRLLLAGGIGEVECNQFAVAMSERVRRLLEGDAALHSCLDKLVLGIVAPLGGIATTRAMLGFTGRNGAARRLLLGRLAKHCVGATLQVGSS
jgi:hypothetical protein